MDLEQAEEIKSQQSNEIAEKTMHSAKLSNKCSKLKEYLKQLNDKNRKWEESYKAQVEENSKREESYKSQMEEIYRYGMEISRLQGLVNSLKSELASVRGVSCLSIIS